MARQAQTLRPRGGGAEWPLVRAFVLALATLGLSGCMGGRTLNEMPLVSRFKTVVSPDSGNEAVAAEPAVQRQSGGASPLISTLQARPTVLAPGTPYAEIGAAVLAAGGRAAEAELRSARLRAEAASKNWLPSVGPTVSLSRLGDVVANLVVEQVVFDNGRKKAERAFAKADVEVAAVTLSADTNDRVATALNLYLAAEEGREQAEQARIAAAQLRRFEDVMQARVEGGVSDMSDLNVIRQKLAEMTATRDREAEAAATAMAELNAMSIRPLDDLSGAEGLNPQPRRVQALSVLLAEAEKDRAIEGAKIERAGLLPGVTAGGTVGDSGNRLGLNLKMDKLLGLGTGASLKAIAATREAATRRVRQAEEEAGRRIAKLESQRAAVQRQATEAQTLARQAKANLDLFKAQYEAGQRKIMEVVGVYETYIAQRRLQVELKYRAAVLGIEIARENGLLVDGTRI